MSLLMVGEPTITALALIISLIMSFRSETDSLNSFAVTPAAVNPARIALAIFSVLSHMVS
jgi:hypothetical protein